MENTLLSLCSGKHRYKLIHLIYSQDYARFNLDHGFLASFILHHDSGHVEQ